MLHVTCDLCGKELHGRDDHFVVKIEIYAALNPSELTEEDLDADHMESLNEMLNEMEAEGVVALEPTSRRLRYDLCPDCRTRYLRDPLSKQKPQPTSKETAPKLGFSEN
jgi:hypothetical protein